VPPTAEAKPVAAIAAIVGEASRCLESSTTLQGAQVFVGHLSVTADLTACFPAGPLPGRHTGWDGVALL